MKGSIGRSGDGDVIRHLPTAYFVRSIGVSLTLLGILTALAACQQPQVVEVPVEVPIEVPVELPVEVPIEVPVELPVEVPVETDRCELPDLNEGRKFVVEAWAIPDANFDVGEPLRLQMRVSTTAYMNIFYVSTSCKVTRLLENRSVAAAEIVDFPFRGSGLQMTVKPPAGEEAFYFVTTRSPMDFLSGADILSETAGIASLDLSPAQFYERLDDTRGRVNPDDWSILTLRTSVVGR